MSREERLPRDLSGEALKSTDVLRRNIAQALAALLAASRNVAPQPAVIEPPAAESYWRRYY